MVLVPPLPLGLFGIPSVSKFLLLSSHALEITYGVLQLGKFSPFSSILSFDYFATLEMPSTMK